MAEGGENGNILIYEEEKNMIYIKDITNSRENLPGADLKWTCWVQVPSRN